MSYAASSDNRVRIETFRFPILPRPVNKQTPPTGPWPAQSAHIPNPAIIPVALSQAPTFSLASPQPTQPHQTQLWSAKRC